MQLFTIPPIIPALIVNVLMSSSVNTTVGQECRQLIGETKEASFNLLEAYCLCCVEKTKN